MNMACNWTIAVVDLSVVVTVVHTEITLYSHVNMEDAAVPKKSKKCDIQSSLREVFNCR